MLKRIKSRVQLLRRGVYSGALRESRYPARVGNQILQLVHSRFNPRWLRQLKIQPGTILELGAFDGGDALRLALEFPQSRVVSVEADPAQFAIVRENLAHTRVDTFNLAVCETDGPIDWYPSTVYGDVLGQGSIFAHTDAYRKKFPFVEQQKEHRRRSWAPVSTACAVRWTSQRSICCTWISKVQRTLLFAVSGLCGPGRYFWKPATIGLSAALRSPTRIGC